jgi:DNA-binding NarL/FixJ family response regulator
MNDQIAAKVVIAETSMVVRGGLASVLKRLPNLPIHPIEVTNRETLNSYMRLHTPDIVFVNPTLGGWFDLNTFKSENPHIRAKFIAIVYSFFDRQTLKSYDGEFSITDDMETLSELLRRLLYTEEATDEQEEKDEQETLSQREKEILVCVVKGMTNKATADQLCISIHTVLTHRRNIARKLQIHSSAGLTIYAIVNKLVELQDVKEIN